MPDGFNWDSIGAPVEDDGKQRATSVDWDSIGTPIGSATPQTISPADAALPFQTPPGFYRGSVLPFMADDKGNVVTGTYNTPFGSFQAPELFTPGFIASPIRGLQAGGQEALGERPVDDPTVRGDVLAATAFGARPAPGSIPSAPRMNFADEPFGPDGAPGGRPSPGAPPGAPGGAPVAPDAFVREHGWDPRKGDKPLALPAPEAATAAPQAKPAGAGTGTASAPNPVSLKRGDKVTVINPTLGGEITGEVFGIHPDGRVWVTQPDGKNKLYERDPVTDRLQAVEHEPPPEAKPEPEPEKPNTPVPKADAKPGHIVTFANAEGEHTTGKLVGTRADGRHVVDLGSDGSGERVFVRPERVVAARTPPAETPRTTSGTSASQDADKPTSEDADKLKAQDADTPKSQDATTLATKADEPTETTSTATTEKPAAATDTPTPEQPLAEVEGEKPPPGPDDEIEYTTKRGRVLKGRVVKGIDAEEARKRDPYAFQLNGGWFIRTTPKQQGDKKEKKPAAPAAATEQPASSVTPPEITNAEHGPWTDTGKKNGDGQAIYENPNGVRAVNDDGVPHMEPTDEHPQKGRVPRDPEARPPKFLPRGKRVSDTTVETRQTEAKAKVTPEKSPIKPTQTGGAPGRWTEIGKNRDGHPVYEDENGVRSYVADGIRSTEKVRVGPRGSSVAAPEDKDPDYQVVEPKPPEPEAAPPAESKPDKRKATHADVPTLADPGEKPFTSADIGTKVRPKAGSGLDVVKNAGTISHVQSSSRGPMISVNGGPHFYGVDFERVPAPAETDQASAESKPKAPDRGINETAFRNAIRHTGSAQHDGTWRIVPLPFVPNRYAVEHTPGLASKDAGKRRVDGAPDGQDPWTLEQAQEAAAKMAAKRRPFDPTEHPGLVIKNLRDGKETRIQPIGTVPPAPAPSGATRTISPKDLERAGLRVVPESEASDARFVLPDGRLIAGWHDETHDEIVRMLDGDAPPSGDPARRVKDFVDATHAAEVGLAQDDDLNTPRGRRASDPTDVSIRHKLTPPQTTSIATYVEARIATADAEEPAIKVNYRGDTFLVDSARRFRGEAAAIAAQADLFGWSPAAVDDEIDDMEGYDPAPPPVSAASYTLRARGLLRALREDGATDADVRRRLAEMVEGPEEGRRNQQAIAGRALELLDQEVKPAAVEETAADVWANAKPGDSLGKYGTLIAKGIETREEADQLAADTPRSAVWSDDDMFAVVQRPPVFTPVTDNDPELVRQINEIADEWEKLGNPGMAKAVRASANLKLTPERVEFNRQKLADAKAAADPANAPELPHETFSLDEFMPTKGRDAPRQWQQFKDIASPDARALTDQVQQAVQTQVDRLNAMGLRLYERGFGVPSRRGSDLKDRLMGLLGSFSRFVNGHIAVQKGYKNADPARYAIDRQDVLNQLAEINDPGSTQSADQTGPALQPTGGAPSVDGQETSDGVQTTVRPGDAGEGAQDVHGNAPGGDAGPAPSGQEPGGAPNADGNAGTRPQGSVRRPDNAGETGSGGDSQGDPDRVPGGGDEAGEPPAATGRPRDQRGRVAGPNVKGQNFVIEPGDVAEDRGRVTKARDNIAAIELVNRLKEEARPATTAEQAVLVKYVGWGGIKNIFRDSTGQFGKGMETLGYRLQDLLTPDEYRAAEASTQNAHYTAEHIVRSMWQAVEDMGFSGGSVFEPGMGIGHFLGMMPPDLAERSTYRGLEMDHLTADIAKLLYPQSAIVRADFAKRVLPEKAFDLVIGNPPFADVVINSDPKYAANRFMLHDYFFAKSIDAVRPGGLLAFVTSAGTMNKINPKAQKYLAERAEFQGGVRLPSSAFRQNAMTDVTTDILFFKRRMAGQIEIADDAPLPDWTGTVRRALPNAEGTTTEGEVSRYFSDHPEMVLGEEGFFDKLYKDRYAVHERPDSDLASDLRAALERLPRGVMEDEPTPDVRAALDFDAPEKKDGSFYRAEDGTLMQYSRGAGRPVAARGAGVKGGFTAADRDRVLKLIPVRDALRAVFAADLARDEAAGAAARKDLNRHYDNFVKFFGPINKAEFSYKRPSIVQQETARAEAREEFRYLGDYFNEGDFDPSAMFAAKATMTEIAEARQKARVAALESGRGFKEGEFDPADMADVVIERRPNVKPFMTDPESYRLRSIEDYNDATGAAAKKPIFTRSILKFEEEPQINSPQDGALWSMNKLGRLDIGAIAEKMGIAPEQVVAGLGDAIYRVPGTRETYQTKGEYLSGDVVTKLDVARAAAETDREMARNVSALEAAQPAPLPPSQVTMMLGMPWIPANVVLDFARDHLQIGQPRIIYSPELGAWNVEEPKGGGNRFPGYHQWSTPDKDAYDLLGHALNRTKPKIMMGPREERVVDTVATQAASDKIEAMKEAFFGLESRLGWVMDDPARANALADIYNAKMNRTVPRVHDGAYLTTPGVAAGWSWRPHQTRVVSRIILEGSTYMAHAVGAGKTSAMIGAGMEMKRLGLVRKPMYVVPNHMLGQFTKEFYEQYPTARIAVASEEQFHTGRRKQFMANVAQDDLDAVIITHSSFKKIPISDAFQADLIEQEIQTLLAAIKKSRDRFTVGRLQNQIAKLREKLSKATGDNKDETLTFEEMGIDFLFVDEAHQFRKLSFASAQSSVKGIDPGGSAQAWDLYTKVRYLDQQKPGRAAVFASGTPVTNTMGELYSLSRFLQPQAMADRGVSHFDAWAQTFGALKTELEETPAGTYAPQTRFQRFMNMPELYQMVSGIMDIVTSKELEQYVVRPKLKGGKREQHMAPRTDILDRYQAQLGARMEAIKARRGKPSPGDDIILSVINDGRHAAIDPRFVEQSQSDPRSKLNMMVDNVVRIYRETGDVQFYSPGSNYTAPSFRGPATQMIFANLGVNGRGPAGFSSYKWMKEAFRRAGIPANEVAFIGDYKSTLAKQTLFNDMNEGKVRILIGSVPKMGTGVNAQRRLIALHNQDPLWYPADDDQRNGRMLRQGNHNPEVSIHDYTTFGTYDSQMWKMMASKAGFIEQFFRGDPNLRDMEDIGEASQYAQASAMSTTDPRIITLTQMKEDVAKARRRQSAHEQEQWTLRSRMEGHLAEAARLEKLAGLISEDITKRQDTRGKNFTITLDGETITDRDEADEVMPMLAIERADSMAVGGTSTIGRFGGFPVQVNLYGKNGEHVIQLGLSGGRVSWLSRPGVVASAEYKLRSFESDRAEAIQKGAEATRDAQAIAPNIGKAFDGGPEIARLANEIRQLEATLKAEAAAVEAAKNGRASSSPLIESRVAASGFTPTPDLEWTTDEGERPVRGLPAGGLAEGSPVPLYSAVQRAADGLKQAKGTGEQMLSMIARTPGVKPEEMEWMGLPDWLRGRPTVTRQEIQDYVRANSLDVREVTLGDGRAKWEAALERARTALGEAEDRTAVARDRLDRWFNKPGQYFVELNGDHVYIDELIPALRAGDIRPDQLPPVDGLPLRAAEYAKAAADEALAEDELDRTKEARAAARANERPTRYGQYTTPGGKDYREMLITLPGKPQSTVADLEPEIRALGIRGPLSDVSGAMLERAGASDDLMQQFDAILMQPLRSVSQQYNSSHWDEPNVVAHVRFDERVAPDGARVLMVQEIQSDWHQEARKKGYRQEHADYFVINSRSRNRSESFPTREAADAYRNSLPESIREATFIQATKRVTGEIPSAPFKTSWPMLIMRRMIKFAVDNGFDRVAWSPGEVHADRYSLAHHVDAVMATRLLDGSGNYRVEAFKNNDRLFDKTVPEKELHDIIGKELAEKIAAQSAGLKKYTGLDLKLGGEGMLGFYDDILPKETNKIIRKFGAKVGKGDVRTAAPFYDIVSADGRENYATIATRERAEAALPSVAANLGVPVDTLRVQQGHGEQTAPVHQFDITEPMRDAVQTHGMALFERKRGITQKAAAKSGMSRGERAVGATPTTTPRPASAPQVSRWLKGSGDGFVDLLPSTPEAGHAAAAAWVLENGRATGNEYLAVVENRTGKIIHAGTNNLTGYLGFDPQNTAGERDAHALHHNHPLGLGQSDVDIMMLASPGISHVVAHGHDGTASSASLAPEFIAPSERTAANIKANRRLLYQAWLKARRQAAQILVYVADQGQIEPELAEHLLDDVTDRLLHAHGVINYVSSTELPQPVRAAMSGALLRSLGHGDAMADLRHTQSVLAQAPIDSLPGPDENPPGPGKRGRGAGAGAGAGSPGRSRSQRGVKEGGLNEEGGGVEDGPLGFAKSPERRPTDTPAFKRWFAGSKVVDARGEPQVVYHGATRWDGTNFTTKQPVSFGDVHQFDRFMAQQALGKNPSIDNIGSWFTTETGDADNPRHGANLYAGKEGVVYPVYLSIKNPKVFKTTNTEDAFEAMRADWDAWHVKRLKSKPKSPETMALAKLHARNKFWGDPDGYQAFLKAQGFDGIMLMNFQESRNRPAQDAWLAFDPGQVKSAIGNSGAFDAADPNILAEGSSNALNTLARLPKRPPPSNALARM